MQKKYCFYLLFAISLMMLQCNKLPTKINKLAKNFQFKPLSDSVIKTFSIENPKYALYINSCNLFYQKRNYDYAWFSKDGISDRIDLFMNLTLDKNNTPAFSADSIRTLYTHILLDTSTVRSQVDLMNLEIRLTMFFFSFANREWTGTDEKLIRKLEWYIPKKKLKYDALLDSLFLDEKNLTSLYKIPIYRQYSLLKTKLIVYRKIEKNDEWDSLKPIAKIYKLQDTSNIIKLIKKKLYVFGDLKILDTTQIFNPNLEIAVKLFQKRFGMTENGVVDILMINELNKPIQELIKQIMINMERCKWVPAELKGDYLAVNIPEFKLHVYEDDKNSWDLNVVVGKESNQTIIFYSKLQYIVLNPYWNVPISIFNKEILPKLRENPDYIAENNMEIIKGNDPLEIIDPYSVNWDLPADNYRSYTVRQKPGVNNSLGKIKFLFPNNYHIYLHDTPSKYLFAESSRSFSHGCIRVENPDKLAVFLLRNQPGWDLNALNKAWQNPQEKYITLTNQVPVFIAYFTTWIDRDGRLNFRKDLYGHDAKMEKMLIEKGEF